MWIEYLVAALMPVLCPGFVCGFAAIGIRIVLHESQQFGVDQFFCLMYGLLPGYVLQQVEILEEIPVSLPHGSSDSASTVVIAIIIMVNGRPLRLLDISSFVFV